MAVSLVCSKSLLAFFNFLLLVSFLDLQFGVLKMT